MTIKDTAEFLNKNDNFLIMQHKRPDGDALGSSAGLCLGLRELGKTAYLMENPETTEKYRQYVEPLYAPLGFVPRTVVVVDTASEDMIQHGADEYSGDVDLCIDHHPSNTEYADRYYVKPERAACGEVIFEILNELGVSITEEIATDLYFAITTDTGCFCYGNTTAETLETAAQLIRLGAPNARLNKIMHRTKSRKRFEIEGLIIGSLEFFRDGKVAFCTVSQDMLQRTGATENDLEDVASIPGQVEGVEIGITIKELPDGTSKISVRTTDYVDANDICSVYGGGGHKMAAGCSIKKPPEEAKNDLLRTIDVILGK